MQGKSTSTNENTHRRVQKCKTNTPAIQRDRDRPLELLENGEEVLSLVPCQNMHA